jgi:5-keto-L-gluconate epimerase
MKLSIAVSTPDAEFSALALKGPFDDNFRLVRSLSYDGVEISVRNPADVDREQLKRLLGEYGLKVPAIATGRAFGEEGLCFSSPDAVIRAAAVKRISDQIDFAHFLGAHVIIGLIVGKAPRNAQSEAWAVESCRACARRASDIGVRLFIEPINRYETSFLITVGDVLQFIDKVGVDDTTCRVLLDTFHMNIEEANIEASIRRAGPRIGHVHVADSNRWHPGAGHIDFGSIVHTLRETGYDGWLTAEILPLPEPMVAARKNIEFMSGIIA